MAFRLPVFEFNYRVVLFLLIFSLPALALGSFVVIGIGQAELREAFGRHLTQIADRTAAATDAYVCRTVVEVGRLASVPAVRAVAAAASREEPDPEWVLELDSQWRGVEGPPPALWAPMDNAATRFLREVVADDPIYREILLTDRHGRLVAASGISSDYYQGDEPWWRDVADTGQLGVGDVIFDESARVFGLEMSTPVFSGETASAIVGIMKAIVDIRELLAAVGGVPADRTAGDRDMEYLRDTRLPTAAGGREMHGPLASQQTTVNSPQLVAFHIPTTGTIMSKFLSFGMTLDQVVARATVNASRVFSLFNDRGTLNVGAPADVAVLELREGMFEFVDNSGNKRTGRHRLFPSGTVLGGKRVPRA